MSIWSIIVAAGTGTRFGALKQFSEFAGMSVLEHSIKPFIGLVEGIIVVTDPNNNDLSIPSIDKVVTGGMTRSDSVKNGLIEVPPDCEHVLVHDSARPMLTSDLVSRVIDELQAGALAVTPVMDLVDSIRSIKGDVLDRSNYCTVQTPQGFRADVLSAAHEQGLSGTDDAGMVSALGIDVTCIPGEPYNFKVTYPNDLLVCEALYGFI